MTEAQTELATLVMHTRTFNNILAMHGSVNARRRSVKGRLLTSHQSIATLDVQSNVPCQGVV